MKEHQRLLSVAAVLLSIVPVLLCFVYVRAFGVTVVYSDQWEMVRSFELLESGKLTLEHLFRLHNEHRFFFPRIIMLGLGSLTAWNNVAEMYVVAALLTASAGVMLWAFRRSFGRRYVLFFIPVAFAILTLRQSLNLLWGYQITFALTQFAAIASLYALHTHFRREGAGRWVALVVAVAFAVIASGSSVQGLMVWLAGLFVFLLNTRRSTGKSSRGSILVWIASGAFIWVLYFFDYQAVGSSANPLGLLAEPVYGASYGLSIIGASMSFAQPLPVLYGALILTSLGLTIYLLLKTDGWRKAGEHSFWISVCAFSLLVLALIAVGRYSNGLEGATASRYVTFSAPLLAGVYALSVALYRKSGGRIFPVAQMILLAGLILFSQLVDLDNAYARGVMIKEDRQRAAQLIIERDEATDEELNQGIRFGAQGIRTRAEILARLEYNVLSPERRPEEAGNIR